jgi:hypothetical protein
MHCVYTRQKAAKAFETKFFEFIKKYGFLNINMDTVCEA